MEGDVYLFPRCPAEIDRLDVQHYALRAAHGGNHLAPIERPARILDSGCGTGQWAHELAAEFPDAVVVGFDVEPSKPDSPGNYRFVRGNLLQGLPFADDQFDFVHQRLLVSGLPVRSWSAVVRDLARVTRPGGWVELVEPDAGIEPCGPATARLFDLLLRLGRMRGLDSTGIVFRSLDGYLRRAGLADIETRTVVVPVGEWAGRVGSLMASSVRAGFTRLCDSFQAAFDLDAADCHDLLLTMQQEWTEHQGHWLFSTAYGRKPRR